ncbi:hypothetical protein Q4R11_02540 [Morganella morganii]
MKKIGDVTSTADKNGEWTNGNVAAGIAPTILEAGWLNSVQREILGVIIAAGMQQDKNDDTQLSKAISKIISGGDYATKTEVNSKLAKDQNGADIQDKAKFIENLGLPELLDKKFDKTGGAITATSKAIDIITEAESAGYIQISDRTGNIIHQLGKISSDNGLTLRNVAGGGSLVISSDGVRFNNKLLGFLNEVSAGGAGWWRDNSTGLLIQWGSTPAGSTSRNVSFPVPFLYAPYVVIHFDGGWHSDAKGSKWGALNKSKTGFTAMTDTASEGGAYLTLGM